MKIKIHWKKYISITFKVIVLWKVFLFPFFIEEISWKKFFSLLLEWSNKIVLKLSKNRRKKFSFWINSFWSYYENFFQSNESLFGHLQDIYRFRSLHGSMKFISFISKFLILSLIQHFYLDRLQISDKKNVWRKTSMNLCVSYLI
jgi:hypothetical protein